MPMLADAHISSLGYLCIRWQNRLQNSSYFCVFKYARAVKQKVCNEAENRERDSYATLYRFLYWFWEKKTDCFAVYWQKKIYFSYSDPGGTLENKLNDLKPIFSRKKSFAFQNTEGQILPTRINNNHRKLICMSRTIHDFSVWDIASPVGVFRGDRISSLPTKGNACGGGYMKQTLALVSFPARPKIGVSLLRKPNGNACYAGYSLSIRCICGGGEGRGGREKRKEETANFSLPWPLLKGWYSDTS